jgi:lipopolysaccharide assembly protein A
MRIAGVLFLKTNTRSNPNFHNENCGDDTGNTSAMTNLMISIITATWVVLIALISVQNASLVNLKFVFWKSIDLPWGLVLAGAVALGFLIGGCLPLLANKSTSTKRK